MPRPIRLQSVALQLQVPHTSGRTVPCRHRVYKVQLKPAVLKQHRAGFRHHLPAQRQDRRRHLAGAVLCILTVLFSYGGGDISKHPLGYEPLGKLGILRCQSIALSGPIELLNSGGQLGGAISQRAAILLTYGIGNVDKHARRDSAHGHQKLTPDRSEGMAAEIFSST